MPLDQTKLQAFKSAAQAQGFDQATIDAFVAAKESQQSQADAELQKYSTAVQRGMPLEYVPSDYRADVYSAVPSQVNTYDPTADKTLQRDLYKNKIYSTQEEKEKAQQAQQEVSLYKQKGLEWDDLSLEGKTLAIEMGIKPEAQLSKEQQEANSIKGIINQFKDLYYGSDQQGDELSFGRGTGAVMSLSERIFGQAPGISEERSNRVGRYNKMKDALVSTIRSAVGETGVMTEPDAERIKSLLPDPGNDAAEAKLAFDEVDKFLKSKYGLSLESATGMDVNNAMEEPETISTDLSGDSVNPELGATQTQSQEEMSSIVGEGLLGKAANLFVGRSVDFINTVKNTPKLVKAIQTAGQETKKLQQQSRELVEQAKLEPNEARKKELLNKARKLDEKAQSFIDVLNSSMDSYQESTGISDEESKRGNLEFAARRGAGLAGEVGSYLLPGVKGLQGAGLGVSTLRGAAQGALYASTAEENKDLSEAAKKGVTGSIIGGTVGAALSKPGTKAISKGIDLIPGTKMVRSTVGSIAKAGKKFLLGDEKAATEELLQLNRQSGLVSRLKNKGLDLAQEAQKYIKDIAGENYDEMLANTKKVLKPVGQKLNTNLKKSNIEVDLSEVADEVVKKADELYQGTQSDQQKATQLIEELQSFVKKHPDGKLSALEANRIKSMFDDVLYTAADSKKNVTPLTSSDVQFKEIFNKAVRKALKQDKDIAAALREYEVLKGVEKALEKVSGKVEGFIPQEPISGVFGAAYKGLTSGIRNPKYLQKLITEPSLGKGIRKAVGEVGKQLTRPRLQTGAIMGLGEGGGLSFASKQGMDIGDAFSPEGAPLYK